MTSSFPIYGQSKQMVNRVGRSSGASFRTNVTFRVTVLDRARLLPQMPSFRQEPPPRATVPSKSSSDRPTQHPD